MFCDHPFVARRASCAVISRRCELTLGLKVSVIQREARKMHREPEFRNALIQVASQFNLLEMVSYSVTPEHGVTGYAGDATQVCVEASLLFPSLRV